MKADITGGEAVQVTVGGRCAHALERVGQRFHATGEPGRRGPSRHLLERRPHRIGLGDLLRPHASHPGAAKWLGLDQPEDFELAQRLTHRSLADPELAGHPDLDDPLARRVGALKDPLEQRVLDLVAQGGAADRRWAPSRTHRNRLSMIGSVMRALVVSGPNDFGLRDVERPVPGPFEVLCRVRATAICGTDPHIIQGHYPGFWPKDWPLIPGHEWCGDVVDVGPGADGLGWQVGTRVAGTSHAACGYCRRCVEGRYNICENFGVEGLHAQYGHNAPGAYAEYVVHSVRSVFPVPDVLSDEEAAMLDPAAIALHTVIRGGHRPGDVVAVIGPGVMGLLVAECALALGAGRVIVVGRGRRLAKARELGHEVVDFTER